MREVIYIVDYPKERRPTAHHSIKMNLYSVLLNDSFALYDAVCATPLEQFQILPLSAQVYPSSAGISSLEMSNLFPQVKLRMLNSHQYLHQLFHL